MEEETQRQGGFDREVRVLRWPRPACAVPSGFQAAMAVLDNQMVMLPRPIRARS